MSVDRINTSGTFKISRDNVEKFLNKYYPNDDISIRDVFNKFGWNAISNRKDGVTKINRTREGWIDQKEFKFFERLAPCIENGSFIFFEIIYDKGYEKWSFEDGKLICYNGEKDIKWVQKEPNYDELES